MKSVSSPEIEFTPSRNVALAQITDMTAAARTFNAAADAAAQAALLPVLPLDGSKPMTGNISLAGYTEGPVVIGTVTTTQTLAITAGTAITATLTASTECTFTMPAAAAGKSFVLYLKQAAATGLGTAVFTGVKWDVAGTPVVTATAGKMDIFSFSSDGTNWYGSVSQGFTP